MSPSKEAAARDKQSLVDRAALSRLHLRHQARDVRGALQWTRVAVSAAPPIGRFVAGMVLAVVAAGPLARFVALASRGFLYARLLRSVITFARAGSHRA